MQLERILHTQGFGSRKVCRALIQNGFVSVAGKICDNPNADFDTTTTTDAGNIAFSVGEEHTHFRAQAYLMLHKPVGYECSNKPTFHPSVFRLFPPHIVARGVQCLGRLDEDTTGLLLLSDDGQFIHRWSSGRKNTPKVYEVTLKHAVTDALVASLLAGVQLHDEPGLVAAAACLPIDDHHLRLTVCEGRYHQVKRMVGAGGNRVEALHRSRIGGLELDSALQPGQWRWLEAEDLRRLADVVV
jgi:16S rRNA pseudouridine516 synthase